MAERRGRDGKTARTDIVRRPAGRLKKLPAGYPALLDDLKQRIRAAQVKAALAVNRELIALYWQIGKSIVERQRVEGWGKAVVDRLAGDLQHEFPGVGGFSPQNICTCGLSTSRGPMPFGVFNRPLENRPNRFSNRLLENWKVNFCRNLWQKSPGATTSSLSRS